MPQFVDVAMLQRIPRPPGVFTYAVPPGRTDMVPGTFVRVPFRRRASWAVILSSRATTDYPKERIQYVQDVVSSDIRLTATELRVLMQIAALTRTTLSTTTYVLLPTPPKRWSSRTAALAESPAALLRTKYLTTHPSDTPPAPWIIATARDAAHVTMTYRTHTQRLRVMRDVARAVLAQHRSLLLIIPHRAWHPMVMDVLREDSLPYVLLDRTSGKIHQWESFCATRTHPVVMLSTRSGAVHGPETLGAILIDEATSDDHVQGDMEPKFDARTIAASVARERNIPLISIASAPRLTEWHHASRRVELQHAEPPPLEIVSLLGHWCTGGRGLLTDALRSGIHAAHASGGIAVILHNRRGRTARVLCLDCHRTIDCSTCGRPLVAYEDALRCHSCATRIAGIQECPSCQSPHLVGRGIGTSGLAAALASAFPEATIARVDRDAPDAPDPRASIIVGSARFLVAHAPTFAGAVRFVGIPLADSYVRGDQFDSRERLLHGLRDALVWAATWRAPMLLQTVDPSQPVLRALTGDDAHFYKEELEERAALQYPPSVRLLRCDAAQPAAMESFDRVRRLLEERHHGTITSIDGPYEFGVVRGKRVLSIIVRFPELIAIDRITAVVADLPKEWRTYLDPLTLRM